MKVFIRNHIRKIVFLTTVFFVTLAYSQKQDKSSIRIGFWNVENFFDPKKDSIKNDEAFTPEGQNRWSYKKFEDKKNKIYKTIAAIGEWEPPAVIGLCEIENAWVLQELCKNTPLSKFKYNFIHYESPDVRGIDVALIYRPDLFKPIESYPISIHFVNDSSKTRDILFVKGIVFDGDTIGIYINHFPSKLGGAAADKRRNFVAEILRNTIDKQLSDNPNLPLVIMGDFNDEPDSYPIKTVLNVATDPSEIGIQTKSLYNLMLGTMNAKGSYKYQAQWSFIDQIIVSKNLYLGEKLKIKDSKAFVFNPDFLHMEDDRYLGTRPYRTFIGLRYIGGFSDHFPVYVDLEKVDP